MRCYRQFWIERSKASYDETRLRSAFAKATADKSGGKREPRNTRKRKTEDRRLRTADSGLGKQGVNPVFPRENPVLP